MMVILLIKEGEVCLFPGWGVLTVRSRMKSRSSVERELPHAVCWMGKTGAAVGYFWTDSRIASWLAVTIYMVNALLWRGVIPEHTCTVICDQSIHVAWSATNMPLLVSQCGPLPYLSLSSPVSEWAEPQQVFYFIRGICVWLCMICVSALVARGDIGRPIPRPSLHT